MAGKTTRPRKARSTARVPREESIVQGAISITLKLDVHGVGGLGPGKIQLLELIDELGSISAAGRSIDMSYRCAWMIVESLNRMFPEPIVVSQHGGMRGGGASLTLTGQRLIRCYRVIQSKAAIALKSEMKALDKLLKGAV